MEKDFNGDQFKKNSKDEDVIVQTKEGKTK